MHNLILHVMRSAIAGGIIDRAIEAEDRKHGDFMKIVSLLHKRTLVSHGSDAVIDVLIWTEMLFCPPVLPVYFGYNFVQDHVEGYLALSGKTKTYFATAVSLWDADFYVKVDDDVHVNIGKSLYSLCPLQLRS